MNMGDIGIKILRGVPISLGIVAVYPLTLDEITQIGEMEYNKCLGIAISKDNETVIEGKNLSHFESALLHCHYEDGYKDLFLNSMEVFLKEPVYYHEQGLFYLGRLEDQRFIDEDTFNQIQTIIRKQNYLKDAQEKDFKPHNSRASELIEKMKKIKEKINKQNNEEGLNLSDIISIVSSYVSNINIFNVWNLTVYQLYTLYSRLLLKENYDSNFMILPHVSNSESLDLKHWATKIND